MVTRSVFIKISPIQGDKAQLSTPGYSTTQSRKCCFSGVIFLAMALSTAGKYGRSGEFSPDGTDKKTGQFWPVFCGWG
jgi:hypothetical protein